MESFQCELCYYNDLEPSSTTSTVPLPTIKPKFLFNKNVIIKEILSDVFAKLSPPHILENTVLQLCKLKNNQMNYGPFLDSDLSLSEQHDELDSFLDGSNVCILLRTRLAVRVESLIENLNNSRGKNLSRALHSLKQIFQDDKEVVQEFVTRNGLQCLRQIASTNEPSHQNYILRALGQLMLYVDGMNSVLQYPEIVEWLYSLLSGDPLVVKLAIKLLVLFMEYAKLKESHAATVISSIDEYHKKNGGYPWSLAMNVIANVDKSDSELVTYIMTFINKVLAAVPDQDTFYDITDWLEEQGMEQITTSVLSKSSAESDVLKQFQIYEVALQKEDNGDNDNLKHIGVSKILTVKSDSYLNGRRKSKRLKAALSPLVNNRVNSSVIEIDKPPQGFFKSKATKLLFPTATADDESDVDDINSEYDYNQKKSSVEKGEFEDSFRDSFVSSKKLLRSLKRKKRSEKYNSLDNLYNDVKGDERGRDIKCEHPAPSRKLSLFIDQTEDTVFLSNTLQTANVNVPTSQHTNSVFDERTISSAADVNSSPAAPSPLDYYDYRRCSLKEEFLSADTISHTYTMSSSSVVPKNSVKSIKKGDSKSKLSEGPRNNNANTNDVSHIILSVKENLPDISDRNSPSSNDILTTSYKDSNISATDEPPDWYQLERVWVAKPLLLTNWDFSELNQSDDSIESISQNNHFLTNAVPPPPPPPGLARVPLTPIQLVPAPPTAPPMAVNISQSKLHSSKDSGASIPKQKTTTRLHWRIYNSDSSKCNIWQKMKTVHLETERFEDLFENKPHDMKKKHETGLKKIEVLDVKRSQAINIGMTKLPHVTSIKSVILKMQLDIINREDVEKLLTTMIPTKEEIESIKAAQITNTDVQLGKAEDFLLELNSVNLLQPRLELWLFQLDFEQIKRDIVESLMDLKCGIQEIYDSKTFVYVLSTILTLGNFLNGANDSSFDMRYLEKVVEVKDTKHKHSLLYHVATIVINEFPGSTDLHSELGAINRCHRVDWEQLADKLVKLKNDCKICWEHLGAILKSDHTNAEIAVKLKKFYWAASEEIVQMGIIHRRVMRRFVKVLEYLGFPTKEAAEMKVQQFCSTISDFAIEYKTTREKYFQLEEKRVKENERKKILDTRIANIKVKAKLKRDKSNNNSELENVVMSSVSLSNLTGEMDFQTLSYRRTKRLPQRSIQLDYMKTLSQSTMINNQHSTSEVSLDQTDSIMGHRAQQPNARNNAKISTRLYNLKEKRDKR